LPLNIDTATAIRRPADQEALVRAVLAADPTDESYWLEWKSRVDLSTAEGRFMVAKGILGMANRHPDHAARTVEGCGYMLVGAEANNLVGLTPIDGADLDNQLRRFLGQQGPQWYPTWIPINGTHVLLVTVEPPAGATRFIFCTGTTAPARPAWSLSAGAAAPPAPTPSRWPTCRSGWRSGPIESGSS
jgi:hypothetical protein